MHRRTLLALTAAAALAGTPVFAADNKKDIVDTATEAGTFGTLLAAAETAGLLETLKGDGPYTVFAPSDHAFADLEDGAVDTLLLPENQDVLTSILTYHVVAGEIMSADLQTGMKVETLEGSPVTINLDIGLMVNDATIVTPDIEAANGVVHVIDKVLMP
ncbi:fasciclin domain-containing protein [Sulfitobacter porphyrae]|uniref:Fasciclin domain-containing protein n=1 Tax=Sulfitobacter porphyrae TaxID=1246864 RepID=A0ABW2B7D6_9RHOB|nr:beta-Ig-H3/fasciclin [Sulfitobacter porphyrae]